MFNLIWLIATSWNVACQDTSIKYPGVCFHFLFQGIFVTQGSNLHLLCLLHWNWQVGSLPLAPPAFDFFQSLSSIWIFATQTLLHSRLPCVSPSPRVCSNSCLLSHWCHSTISFSVTRSFPTLSLFHYQGLVHWIGSSHQVAKVSEFQLQHQYFQWIFRVDFFWDWLAGSSCSPRDPQESSPTPQFKRINSSALTLFMVQLSHLYMTTGKIIALTTQNFLGKVMSLL